jgi:hypothetical protein
MTNLPIIDKDSTVFPYFLKGLKTLMDNHATEIANADDKWIKIKELWLREYNSQLLDEKGYFSNIRFINSIDCIKFSLTFY